MSKETMTLALEHAKRDERHLNHAETRYWCRMYRDIAEKAIEALAEQQPVATNKVYVTREQLAELYPPASKPWSGLTDEEYSSLHDGLYQQGKSLGWVVDQIEAKLKEKNT